MAPRRRALIAEDHPDSRDLYVLVLERAGFDVEVAADGETALQKAREQRLDVVVLDLGLPRVNGLEAMYRLKRDEQTRRIPIVVITGYAGPGMTETLLASGAARVCVKPCSPEQLEEAVRLVVGT